MSFHEADSVTYPPSQHSTTAANESQSELAPPTSATSALPPVDGGKDAWSFLAAATIIEVLVWGLPFCAGVLRAQLTKDLFPDGTPGQELISVALSLQSGLMYCSAIVFGPMLSRWPQHRRTFQIAALVIATAGILISAFVTKPWHLMITLGLLYPFSCMFYLPAAYLMFEWFSQKRGVAFGIMYSGTGAGGTLYPFIVSGLMNKFGYRNAMLSLGLGYLILGGLAIIPIKARVPLPARDPTEKRRKVKLDTKFLKRSPFYAFASAILLSSMGNFLPSLWVPSFALDLHLSETEGTILIAAMNAASIPGLLVMGWLCDRTTPRVVITISCLGTAVACLLLWGFSTNIKILSIFCIAFGALGLSFPAIWTPMLNVIARDDPILIGHLFSVFAFLRGLGNITSGPVSNALLASNIMAGSKGGYGVKNYGSLMLYTGLTLVASSIAGVLYRDRRSEGGGRLQAR
ncbi:putative monocarboxylic acid transporter [Meredithblackwellia eburnea MCA 4105]